MRTCAHAVQGWLDGDWSWSPLYDTLNACGVPVDKQAVGDGKVRMRI